MSSHQQIIRKPTTRSQSKAAAQVPLLAGPVPGAAPQATSGKPKVVNVGRGKGPVGTARHPTIAEWMSDPANAYVGRRTFVTPAGSAYGNPFKVEHESERSACIAKFKAYIESNPALLAQAKHELRGKNLGCWCHPLPCHADVLLELVNADD